MQKDLEYMSVGVNTYDDSGLSRPEYGMLVGAAALAVACSYLLITNFSFVDTESSSRGQVIAEIVDQQNSVRRRPSDLPVWASTLRNQQLYQRDQIYTDSKSRARIAFDKDNIVDVEENALVIIEKRDEGARIQVSQGSVIASVGKGSKSLELNVRGTTTKISGNGARVVIQDNAAGKPTVSVVSGSAEITNSAGSVQRIEQNQSATIDGAAKTLQIAELPKINLNQVNDGNKLIAGTPYLASWSADKKYAAYKFELSDELNFSRVLSTSSGTQKAVRFKVPSAGRYYWRVGVDTPGNNAKTIYSVPATLDAIALDAPVPAFPANAQVFKTQPAAEGVNTYLDWSGDYASYEIEIATDETMREKILSKTVNGAPYSLVQQPKGIFFWKVRGVFNNKIRTPWSAVQSFSVEAPDAALVPKEIPKLSGGDSATTNAAKSQTQSELLTSTPPTPQPTLALAAKEIQSTSTEPKELAVPSSSQLPLAEYIDSTSPTEGQVFRYRVVQPNISFNWTSTESDPTKNYVLQIALDEKFESVAFNRNTKSTSIGQTLKSGKYFWRVVHDQKGDGGSLASTPVRTFSVVQDQSKPIAIAPRQNGWIDLDSKQDREVELAWSNPVGINKSVILLSSVNDFSKIIAKKETKDTKATVTILGDGTYYWFVTAIDSVENASIPSDIYQFNVTTTKVSPIKDSYQSRLAVRFGYVPSTYNFKQVEVDGTTSEISGKFQSGGILQIHSWLTNNFGVYGTYEKYTGQLNSKQIAGSTDTPNTETKLSYMSGLLRYRWDLFEKKYPTSLALRGGYENTQVVTYAASEDDTTLKRDNSLHHAVAGMEIGVPITRDFELTASNDYLFLMSSYPLLGSKQFYVKADVNILYHFLKHGILGYGLFYRKQEFYYNDAEVKSEGRVYINQSGMIYSLGLEL